MRAHVVWLALLFMVGLVYADSGSIDVAEAGIWTAVTAIAGGWLSVVFRPVRPPAAPWLRPSLWDR